MQHNTFDYVWALLQPAPTYADRESACRNYWNSLSLSKQRRIFYTLREQKNNGVYIKENPLFALQDCNPQPTNWNGRDGINKMMKTEHMVIAKYGDRYGSYTLLEAWLFEMSDAVAANFQPDTLSGKKLNMFNVIKRKE